MKHKIEFVQLIMGLFLPLALYANKLPQHFPKDLLYNGMAIDSLCFFEIENDKATVSLDKCGIHSQTNRKMTGVKEELLKQGFIGFDYLWPIENKNDSRPNSYSYYRVIGKINGSYIIYALNGSGGSGQFSDIYLVKRAGDTLTIETIAGGDRCNNGINKVKQQGNKFVYNANITSADLLNLAKQKQQSPNAYDELDSCAVCCIGTANMEVDPVKNTVKLLSVSLAKDKIGQAEHSGSKQECLNKLMVDYQKQGKNTLSPQALDQLVERFNKTCMG